MILFLFERRKEEEEEEEEEKKKRIRSDINTIEKKRNTRETLSHTHPVRGATKQHIVLFTHFRLFLFEE